LFGPLIAKMQDRLAHEIPGVGLSFTQPIEMRFNELVAGVRSDVGVKVFGDDLDVLKVKADQVVRVLSSIPGAADVKAEQVAGLPMARIVVDRSEIARYGINASRVLDTVEAIRAGRRVGTIYEGRRRFDLIARFTDAVSKDLESLSKIPVGGNNGRQIVPLGQLAKLEYATGPAQISRERIQRRIVVEANVRGRDLGGFVREARAKVARELKLDPGYYLEWGGQFENLERASSRLMLVVPLTLALIFSLLYFAFQSVRVALIIFLNIPFAVTGGVFALALRGMPFSISAAVGFIALFGVAVLNGVVLLSYVCAIQESGKPADDAAYERSTGKISAGDADGPGCESGIHPNGSFPRNGRRSAKTSGHRGHRRVDHFDRDDVVGFTCHLWEVWEEFEGVGHANKLPIIGLPQGLASRW
jgi:cobalt-zinc-cadmium resistance protein CzcA